MKKPTICRYCGGIIRLVPAADVYGSSTERLGMQNEYLYQCQNCNARVGCHKGTTRPLGDVANEILRCYIWYSIKTIVNCQQFFLQI